MKYIKYIDFIQEFFMLGTELASVYKESQRTKGGYLKKSARQMILFLCWQSV